MTLHHTHRGYKRERHLMKRYGLTQAAYDALLAGQGGHCRFCDATKEPDGRPLAVDHDKETQRIRGILCHRHNSALGTLGDNEAGMQAALSYIRGE